MNAKCIYLAGVPASGKSTLFKRLRTELFQDAEPFKHGLLRGIKAQGRQLYMLGVFDGSTFEGTDRLSMAVINDTLEWFNKLPQNAVVYVEGDRLFNKRFLTETKAKLFAIDANPVILQHRHKSRGDEQAETFLRSRKTKVDNIVKLFGVTPLPNNTANEHERIFFLLKKEASNELCTQ
ncbi:MAG: P-loop-containing protein [Bacteroides sp.]|nr:P-loop-containing protein [Bacteroides sp.]